MDDITGIPEATAHPPLRIALDDPVDVLSWLPFQLGFQPHESAVMVALRRSADSMSIGVVARFDLADLAREPRLQAEAERHLARESAVGALFVLVSNEPWLRISHRKGDAGEVLRWWLQTPWADPATTWLLSDEAFRCVECSDPPCCPAAGRPAAILEESEVTATMVFRGHSYASTRRELVADMERSAPGRRAASAAATRYEGRRDRIDPMRWRRLALRRWVELIDRIGQPGQELAAPIEPALVGAVLAGLADDWVRDGVLLWAATGRALSDRERGAVLEALFTGSVNPHEGRLHAANAALGLLGAHASRRWRVPVLSTAAWLAWWGGDGARAALLLERVAQIDSSYPLARLLSAVVAGGVAPGWVREPRSA
ncbi:DUF4192 domain-containing protein [Ruania halotolerans]|uniref:DUF4192 domain-containing protein n=1 Tax=Ruania halotolerans TaxID=2897773 RepID=UPI001E53D879|nr:DUF4192 domain-containing protein [Ruania halotolerans]UFU04818.1 DUF4192 domain-containing protein [Ruania halotolerans]